MEDHEDQNINQDDPEDVKKPIETEDGDDEEDYEMKFPSQYHSTTDHDNTTV